MTNRILKLPDVMAMTALSRSSIYDFIKKKTFPAPCPLGARAVGWLEAEIVAWINGRAESRINGVNQSKAAEA